MGCNQSSAVETNPSTGKHNAGRRSSGIEEELQSTPDVTEGDGHEYRILKTGLGDAVLIKPYTFADQRGSFTEFFNLDLFRDAGLMHATFVQDCYSVSAQGVLRGFHGDYRTTKLITVVRGEVLAAIVDLNPDSPTYFHVFSSTLSEQNRRLLLVPPGFGNSFLVTSVEDSVYLYKKTTHFIRGGEMTLRWDCPDLVGDFAWPTSEPLLSERDSSCPVCRSDFEDAMRKRVDLENNPFVNGALM